LLPFFLARRPMNRFRTHPLLLVSLTCALAILSGCGGGGDTAAESKVSATVSGLREGTSFSITTTDGKVLEIKADGTYVLSPTAADSASAANVRIEVQPAGQTCTVAQGSSTTSLQVSCIKTPTYPIGGTLGGLQTGTAVTLLNNAGEALTLQADGSFTFPTQVEASRAYGVTVGTQPAGQHCTVSKGSGAVTQAVSDIAVACAALPTVGGSVTGLGSGYSLVLVNGSDRVTLSGTGAAQTLRFATVTP
jgi:hypothetical protein